MQKRKKKKEKKCPTVNYQKCKMFSKIQHCPSVLIQDYQTDQKADSRNMR